MQLKLTSIPFTISVDYKHKYRYHSSLKVWQQFKQQLQLPSPAAETAHPELGTAQTASTNQPGKAIYSLSDETLHTSILSLSVLFCLFIVCHITMALTSIFSSFFMTVTLCTVSVEAVPLEAIGSELACNSGSHQQVFPEPQALMAFHILIKKKKNQSSGRG